MRLRCSPEIMPVGRWPRSVWPTDDHDHDRDDRPADKSDRGGAGGLRLGFSRAASAQPTAAMSRCGDCDDAEDDAAAAS
jgi:hypothetical protein